MAYALAYAKFIPRPPPRILSRRAPPGWVGPFLQIGTAHCWLITDIPLCFCQPPLFFPMSVSLALVPHPFSQHLYC